LVSFECGGTTRVNEVRDSRGIYRYPSKGADDWNFLRGKQLNHVQNRLNRF
jgi:hypothetical protein